MLATLAPEPRPLLWRPAWSGSRPDIDAAVPVVMVSDLAPALPEITPAVPWRPPAVTIWRDVPVRCHRTPGPLARLRAAIRARGHGPARWIAEPWRVVADMAMPTRYRNLRAAAEP